jgi:hypothetical protein
VVSVQTTPVSDRFVVLREPSSPPVSADDSSNPEQRAEGKGKKNPKKSGDKEIAALSELLGGSSPWPFFDGVFDESGCRSPRLSRGALVAGAICGGKGGRDGRTEYVVVRQGDGVRLYRVPIWVDGGDISLSPDGGRLAVVVNEDERAVLHILDLAADRFVRISGAFENPRQPLIAGEAAVVAFEATVDGVNTVLRVDLAEGSAKLAWSEPGDAALLGISDNGNRLLVRNRRVDFREVFLVDPGNSLVFDISGRSGDVRGAALHGGGSQVVFSAQVGGACGLYWADLVTRRRSNLLGTNEYCFGQLHMDESRRFVHYEQTMSRASSRHYLRDRMSRGDAPHTELLPGCEDIALEPTGHYLAAFCGEGDKGPGLFVFAIDQKRRKR